MTDHLLIGILIGMASGIVALIVISAVTLHRFEGARRRESARLQQALVDIQGATRDVRDESAAGARALRDELTGGLKSAGAALARGLGDLGSRQQQQADVFTGRLSALTEPVLAALRDHPMTTLGDMAEAQERRLGAVAAELRNLADAMEARLQGVRSWLDDEVRQIQADTRDSLEHLRSEAMGHAKDLSNDMLESVKAHTEQVRTAFDEKLELTLERRLSEHFSRVDDRLQLVSERLDQVDRSLGEMQTFAAGLGNLQRALANVRLGGTRTRPARAVGSGDVTDVGSPPVARKRRRTEVDDPRAAVEKSPASSTS